MMTRVENFDRHESSFAIEVDLHGVTHSNGPRAPRAGTKFDGKSISLSIISDLDHDVLRSILSPLVGPLHSDDQVPDGVLHEHHRRLSASEIGSRLPHLFCAIARNGEAIASRNQVPNFPSADATVSSAYLGVLGVPNRLRDH
jgi:hypothetical protein